MYFCSECGDKATIVNETINRTCEHTSPIVANISATAYSVSSMNNSIMDKLINLFKTLLK